MIKPTVQLTKPDMQSHFYQIFDCPLGDQANPSSYFVCELIFKITSNEYVLFVVATVADLLSS